MTPETADTTQAPAVGVPRLVRLTDEVRGMYCKFAAGEVVMHTLYDNGLARLERQPWRNSLAISNVHVTSERWLDYEVIESRTTTILPAAANEMTMENETEKLVPLGSDDLLAALRLRDEWRLTIGNRIKVAVESICRDVEREGVMPIITVQTTPEGVYGGPPRNVRAAVTVEFVPISKGWTGLREKDGNHYGPANEKGQRTRSAGETKQEN